MKKLLPIIIALLLAAIASFGIMDSVQRFSASGRTLGVVVAARDLQAGETLSQNDLQTDVLVYPVTRGKENLWKFVFSDCVSPSNIGTLQGRAIDRETRAGQPILTSMLKKTERKRNVVNWKTRIQKGQRAVTIPVESIGMVSGLVEVGDHVDVLVSLNVPQTDEGPQRTINMPVKMGESVQQIQIPYESRGRNEAMTFYLLQDVEILAVGSMTERPEILEDAEDPFAELTRSRGGSGGVTVALSPDYAQLLAFAVANGDSKFFLTLRRPGDDSVIDEENTKPADFDTILRVVGARK